MNLLETEESVIRCIFQDTSLLSQCDLQSNDFTTEQHQRIFNAMRSLEAAREPIDLVTVATEIENSEGLNVVPYLTDLFQNAYSTPKHFESYVKHVRGNSRNKQAWNIYQEGIAAVEHKFSGDHIEKSISALMALDKTEKKYTFTSKEMLTNALKHIEEARDKQGLMGVTTGIRRIDEAIGGFQDTDLNIIAARPAMGKTALALNMMLNANCPAGLISSEQGNVQAGLRLIAIQGEVDSRKLRTGDLDDDESKDWGKVTGAVLALKQRGIYINDKPRINISELTSQARQWKQKNGIKILFVDYLQRIQGSNRDHQRTEQVTEVTQSLKALARELEIPVVALAQVKRIDERSDRRPKLGDMADASEIEKEADVIMTLYRDEVYVEDSKSKGIAEIDIVKNRHGITGVVRCQFIGQYFKFKDFETNVRNIRA